jgi:hypothetical protein
MSWGTCGSCIAKDSEIAHLRELVTSLRKENLTLVDLRAANATFPRPQAPPPAEQKEPVEPSHASPAQVRDTLYTPPLTFEKVEELADLEAQFEQGGEA